MTKPKNADENTSNATEEDYEEYIESLDLKLINLENFAVSFLVIGYGLYTTAGNIDTNQILSPNEKDSSGDDTFIIGQKFVLMGYIALYAVSLLRIQEKYLEISLGDKTLLIDPFIAISQTYLASVIINYTRLKAFIDIKIDNEVDRQNKAEKDGGE